MRIYSLLAIALGMYLITVTWSGAIANPIDSAPTVLYSDIAAQDLWNTVVADHHVAHPHDPHTTEPDHHVGDPHHTGDPHHPSDPHHTSDPHHPIDPHPHTGDHPADPHHHAAPTHHDIPPHHHAGDPHSPTDPMHVMGLSITTDNSGHHVLHVDDTQLTDLNGDGHIDHNDALLHFGHASFSSAVSLDGDMNYVQFADGQQALILVDTAHFPESFDLASALANLSINTVPSLLGDYDHSGTVDGGDYVVWRKAVGRTGAGLAADGNGNNQIDGGDYDVWRTHIGATSAAGVSTSAIPEPATLIIAIVTFVAVLVSGRRR